MEQSVTRLQCPDVSVCPSQNFDPTPSGSGCTCRDIGYRISGYNIFVCLFDLVVDDHPHKHAAEGSFCLHTSDFSTHLLPLRNSVSRKRIPSLAPAFSFFNLSSPSITKKKKKTGAVQIRNSKQLEKLDHGSTL